MADETGGRAIQAMVGGGSAPAEMGGEEGSGVRRSTRSVAATGSSAARPATRRRAGAPTESEPSNLKRDLRDFAAARPQGWGHQDWLDFLEWLRDRGHNIEDRDAIGRLLERERLELALTPIRGMGPQRRAALVDRYGTVWNLRNAEVDEIASAGKISHELAERVRSAIA